MVSNVRGNFSNFLINNYLKNVDSSIIVGFFYLQGNRKNYSNGRCAGYITSQSDLKIKLDIGSSLRYLVI